MHEFRSSPPDGLTLERDEFEEILNKLEDEETLDLVRRLYPRNCAVFTLKVE